VATKALLNIAVMLSLVPPTGVTLPFISFGGSSLVTLMVGVGLLLSVQRMTLLRTSTRERKVDAAPNLNHSGRDRRSRLPGAGNR
jgi:cell division protein FtsW